jgi:hypothetical protein
MVRARVKTKDSGAGAGRAPDKGRGKEGVRYEWSERNRDECTWSVIDL